MRAVYLQAEQFQNPPPPFKCGAAGLVWLAGGKVRRNVQVQISANSAHALIGHGVITALNKLPLQGRLGGGMDVLIPPPVLEGAQQILYAADAKTYGGQWEFCVARNLNLEYRVRVQNREYQRTLSRLTYMLGAAGRQGRAAWLRL